MKPKQEMLILTSAFYFTGWMTLIVIYQLSGWARISGAAITLGILTILLTSMRAETHS